MAISLAAATIAAGALALIGSERTNAANAKQAAEANAFGERMSSTAHQREVADLRAAGLNPILSSRYGGSSTPHASMAQIVNSLGHAASSATDVYRAGLEGQRNPSQVHLNESSAKRQDAAAELDREQMEVSRAMVKKIGLEGQNIEAGTAKVLYELRNVLPSMVELNRASTSERAQMAERLSFEIGKLLPLDEQHRELEVSRFRDSMESIFQESEIDKTKWGVFWRYVGRVSSAVLGGLFK